MEWYEATLFLLGTVLALMLIGLPVAIAFIGDDHVRALLGHG